MTTSDQLRQAWIALEAEEQTLPGNYERRVFAQAKCAIYAGLVRPSRQIKLTIGVPLPLTTEGLERTTRGFQVVRQHLAQERNTRVSLELTQATFRELFEVMAEDVAGSVAAAVDNGSAVDAMRHRLNHWERFMEVAGPDGLDRAEQMGLFGELVFLRALLDAGVSPIDALSWWLGPTRANQDFLAGNHAVEVKTTSGNSPTILKIANELQLDDADCESLHLFHLWVKDVAGGGATLPQMIDEIAQRFSGHAEQIFLDRLAEAGYHEVHRPIYEDVGYAERQRRYYEVRDEFPRIRRADLRSGVSHADYAIDLSGFATYTRDEANVITTLHGGKDE